MGTQQIACAGVGGVLLSIELAPHQIVDRVFQRLGALVPFVGQQSLELLELFLAGGPFSSTSHRYPPHSASHSDRMKSRRSCRSAHFQRDMLANGPRFQSDFTLM